MCQEKGRPDFGSIFIEKRTGTPLSSDRWKEVTLWDDWSSRANYAELKQLKENNVLAGGYSGHTQHTTNPFSHLRIPRG